jgi:hypothetical protein
MDIQFLRNLDLHLRALPERSLDQQGRTIKGAVIKFKKIDTNLEREAITDENGLFNINQLPPGIYEIAVSAENFRPETKSLELTLGTTTVVFIVLKVGKVGEVILVKNTEEGRTESSTNIPLSRIEGLPINRRDFLEFTFTTPRARQDPRSALQGVAISSTLSFNGQGSRLNNVTKGGSSLKSMITPFHKTHIENLVAMIVGIVYARAVTLPKIAGHAPMKDIQLESRVQRFERLLDCGKFLPLEVLKPITTRVLRSLARRGEPLMILMDRSWINDTLNLLHVAVAFGGRALPLGWIEVPWGGNSNLALQKELLSWLKDCLPRGVEVFIVADREFHSIHLAQWIETEMGCHFVLRIKAGTWVFLNSRWRRAGGLAIKGSHTFYTNARVTRNRKATHLVNLATVWSSKEEEPWLLISDIDKPKLIESIYAKRFWIEEMFSDHKSRGLNLEQS